MDTDSWTQVAIFNELDYSIIEPPSWSDFFTSLAPPKPLPSIGGAKLPHDDSVTCHVSIQQATDSLLDVPSEEETAKLEKALKSLQSTSNLAYRYILCPSCDNGCPRLINLALLHQRQVNLLCNIAKNPTTYLDDVTDCGSFVRLGEYQPSKHDELLLRQVMMLGATRDVGCRVRDFESHAREYQEGDVVGTNKLSEAGKLNLKWLLDVATNLTRRLECVKSTVERAEWVSQEGLPTDDAN